MIVNLLHHLFYRIYWWNIKIIKDDGTPIYMTFLGTLFLFGMNINSLLFIFYLIKYGTTLSMSGVLYWFIVSLVIILNISFYLKKGEYKYLISNYIDTLSVKQIKKRDVSVIIYIILSFTIYILVLFMVEDANSQ
ncbi:MAG TPA: hypothetical protein VKX35_01010 [Fermentimonas sp.]|nr:hypothetical protein [Fermentimonas sp.]